MQLVSVNLDSEAGFITKLKVTNKLVIKWIEKNYLNVFKMEKTKTGIFSNLISDYITYSVDTIEEVK